MKRLLLVALMVFAFVGISYAADITFAWDLSVSDTGNPGGYRLYLSKQSGNYVELAIAEVPQGVNTVTIQDNDKPGKWYAVATYFMVENTQEYESGHSNEVSFIAKPQPPGQLHKVE